MPAARAAVHGFDRDVRGEPGLDHAVHASRGTIEVGERLVERELVGRAVDRVVEVEREVAQLGCGEPLQGTDEGHELHPTSLGGQERL